MKKICKICGKEFDTKSSRRLICYDNHYHKCPVCGKDVLTSDLQHLNSCCSSECTKKLRTATTKQRFDTWPSVSDEANAKRSKTNIERYGVDNVFKNSDIQEKAQKRSKEVVESKIHSYTRQCNWCGHEFKTDDVHQKVCDSCKQGTCKTCGKEFIKSYKEQVVCDDTMCKAQYVRHQVKLKPRKCEICGKEFYPESPRQKVCKHVHMKVCQACGKEFECHTLDEYRDKKACSISCVNTLREQTNMNRYGVNNVMKAEEFQNKLKKTNQDRFGSPWFFHTPEYEEKMRQTMIERYGVEYPMQNDDIRSRVESTMLERYGSTCYLTSEDYRSKCPDGFVSKVNREFGDMLKLHDIPYKFEKRIENRSYDIELLNDDVVIEIDPTYTHNALGNHWTDKGLDKKYHTMKSDLAKSKGYRCIHIFDWDDPEKIIQSLECKMRFYARNLLIKEVSSKKACEFEEKYHLQGSCTGQKVCFGLYYGFDLIQVMTFGKPRYNKHYDWELLRLCTRSGVRVVGGAQRLFKHFIRQFEGSIISYCDRSKFNGNVYYSLGMNLDHVTSPNKVWSKGNKKVTNNLLLQRGYDQLFNAHYGKGTSNEELMLKDGWLPVYDCGQYVFTYV